MLVKIIFREKAALLRKQSFVIKDSFLKNHAFQHDIVFLPIALLAEKIGRLIFDSFPLSKSR